MGLTVILPALRGGCDHQGRVIRRDLQRTFVLCDRVVIRLEVCAFRIGDRVGHFTLGHCRNRTGRLDVCCFAGNKSVSANCHIRLRQRCSVVRFFSAFTLQGDCPLFNAQCTDGLGHAAVVSGVRQHVGVGIVLAVGSVIILYTLGCRSNRHSVVCRQCEHLAGLIGFHFGSAIRYRIDFILVGLTVILPALRGGCDHYGRVIRRDLQCAIDCRHQVVTYRDRSSNCYSCSIHCRNHVRLSTNICNGTFVCHHYRKGVIVTIFQRTCREVSICMCISVIRPAVCCCCDCYSFWINRQLTSHVCNVVVSGILADCRRARYDLAGIFANIGLLAVQCDACQSVAALQAFHRHLARVCVGRVILALRRSVVGVALVIRRNRQRRLRDRQFTGYVCNVVVSGILADCRCARYDLAGVLADIGLLAVQCDARQSVAALQAFHRHLARVCVGRVILALRRSVVGVALVIRRNRQRCLRDRQFNICTIRCFLNGISLLTAGNSRCNRSSICANIRSGCRYRINCRTILNRRNINTKARRQCIFNFIANQVFNSIACVALFLTIISLFCFAAFNNNLNFSFPYCEDSIIRKVFIRSNLRNLSCCSFLIILSIFIIDIRITQFLCPVGIVSFPSSGFSRCCCRISGRTCVDELPSQELIPCSGRNAFLCGKTINAYSFVNLKIIICTAGSASIIHEPADVCGSRSLNRNILSAKLYCIFMLLNTFILPARLCLIKNISIFIKILCYAIVIYKRYINRIIISIYNLYILCILCKYCKCLSCVDRIIRINIYKCGSVVCLHDPVCKLISFRSIDTGPGIGNGSINIQTAVFYNSAFSINSRILGAVLYMNTICTFQCYTPLGIKDQFPGNPETVFIRSSFFFTIRIIFCYTVIHNSDICIENFIIFVVIPANKRIAFCNTGIHTDTAAYLFTEISCWCCSTPVNRNSFCRWIHLQLYTILDLPPFCVNCYTANRHAGPGVWSRTASIQIPTLENITSLCRGWLKILLFIGYFCALAY